MCWCHPKWLCLTNLTASNSFHFILLIFLIFFSFRILFDGKPIEPVRTTTSWAISSHFWAVQSTKKRIQSSESSWWLCIADVFLRGTRGRRNFRNSRAGACWDLSCIISCQHEELKLKTCPNPQDPWDEWYTIYHLDLAEIYLLFMLVNKPVPWIRHG